MANDSEKRIAAPGFQEAPAKPDIEMGAEAAKKKAKVLFYSKPLDIHLWSDHPEVDSFVDQMFADLSYGRKKEAPKRNLKVLLLNLFKTWVEDPKRVIAVPFDNNAYKARSQYNELEVSATMIGIVKQLLILGLVDHSIGYFKHEKGRGMVTRIWPTHGLIDQFKEFQFTTLDIYPASQRVSVVLRKNDPDDKKVKIDIEYEPNVQTKRTSEVLSQYNELLRHTFIDIPTLDDSKIEIEEDGKKRPISCFSERQIHQKDIQSRVMGVWR